MQRLVLRLVMRDGRRQVGVVRKPRLDGGAALGRHPAVDIGVQFAVVRPIRARRHFTLRNTLSSPFSR